MKPIWKASKWRWTPALSALGLLASGCIEPPGIFLPSDCSAPTDLFLISAIRQTVDHPCGDWVEATHGRVARTSSASAVVYSRLTTNANALLVSAMHALPVGTFSAAATDVPERVFDPRAEAVVESLRLVTTTGVTLSDALSPAFTLYTPAIPGDQHVSSFFDLLPRYDFYLAVADGQQASTSAAFMSLLDEPTPLFDPMNVTLSSMPTTEAEPGALVLVVGFPSLFDQGQAFFGERRVQRASVGRVLTDTEAVTAVKLLAEAGDVEGDIAYDAEAEIFIEGAAEPGMSGGGIFDEDGRLVGVLVRATDQLPDRQFIRAVRTTFITAQFDDAVDQLPEDEQAALTDFLEVTP